MFTSTKARSVRILIGALHAIQAYWTVTDATATIVMPTGTGKTKVMLSILVSCRCPKLLVVAPTDALRAQLAEKFVTLGVLKMPGCKLLNANAKQAVGPGNDIDIHAFCG